jgi:hypothetical protein
MPAGSIKAIVAALLVMLGLSGAPARPDRLGLPALMLWSWDRADDLRFIDPADTGVAYLAASIHLGADGIPAVVPRRNSLLLPAGTATLPVIHIALDRAQSPGLDDTVRRRLVSAIIELRPASASALQIDFEATQSQQRFLAATVQALHEKLPDTRLSMTALSAWCLYESWLDALPVDEVVPMLFRLGPDRMRIAAHFSAGGDFRNASCRGSFGIATDETRHTGFEAPSLSGRRVYIFAPKRWAAATYATIRQELAR